MIIKIDALDTLFFRDGRPFTMGEDTWANSIFPCYPSVIYGALRTVYFAENPGELDKANEDDDPTANLKIQAIYLKVDNEPYWSLPLDCVKNKKEKAKDGLVEVSLLKRSEIRDNIISNYPCTGRLYPFGKQKVDDVAGGILDEETLRDYLYSELIDGSFWARQLSDCITLEPKIGIGRDKQTRTTLDEKKLYRVEMKRPEDSSGKRVSIVVKFSGLKIPTSGFMKLGGEGKVVHYKKTSEVIIQPPKLEENVFKIYLTTPAIFEQGWLPWRMDKKDLIGIYKGLKLKLLTAAIGKYISIGGFDMKKQKPKTMCRAVPAGSVYYFKLLEGDLSKVVDVFHDKSISDFQSEQGFGLSFVGRA